MVLMVIQINIGAKSSLKILKMNIIPLLYIQHQLKQIKFLITAKWRKETANFLIKFCNFIAEIFSS